MDIIWLGKIIIYTSKEFRIVRKIYYVNLNPWNLFINEKTPRTQAVADTSNHDRNIDPMLMPLSENTCIHVEAMIYYDSSNR